MSRRKYILFKEIDRVALDSDTKPFYSDTSYLAPVFKSSPLMKMD